MCNISLWGFDSHRQSLHPAHECFDVPSRAVCPRQGQVCWNRLSIWNKQPVRVLLEKSTLITSNVTIFNQHAHLGRKGRWEAQWRRVTRRARRLYRLPAPPNADEHASSDGTEASPWQPLSATRPRHYQSWVWQRSL